MTHLQHIMGACLGKKYSVKKMSENVHSLMSEFIKE